MAPRQVQAEARPQDPQDGVLGGDGEGHLRGPGAQQLWTRQIEMKIHIPTDFYFKSVNYKLHYKKSITWAYFHICICLRMSVSCSV